MNTSMNMPGDSTCNKARLNVADKNIAINNFCNLFFGIFVCLIMVFCLVTSCKKRKNYEDRKTSPPSILYYLAKTSYKADHSDLCMQLIEKENYSLNDVSSETELSVFLCSCLSGNPELVSFMIERGANAKSLSCHGDSALYLATYSYLNSTTSDLRVITLLISSGCDVNHQNNSGFTALHLASSKGNLILTQYFLLKGADPNLPNYDGLLPFQLAINAGYETVAEHLIQRMAYKKTCSSVYNF